MPLNGGAFPQLSGDLSRIQERLIDLVSVADEKLREPVLHSIKRGGHLFRPILALTSFYILSQDPDRPASPAALDAAAATELLHIATLHHDDLIDNAQTRRGGLTVNAQFGDAAALLTGDYLLARSMEVAASLGRAEMELMSETLSSICMGQMLETLQLFEHPRSEEDYFSAIAGKTAALMRASAMIGAIEAAADEETQAVLAYYGQRLGLAFQIWDDILDLCQNGNTGKAVGKDLDNGVYTLPVIYAIREFREDLVPMLGKAPLSSADRHAALGLIQRSGALHKAARFAQLHVNDAIEAITRLECPAAGQPGMAERLLNITQHIAPQQHAVLQTLQADTELQLSQSAPLG